MRSILAILLACAALPAADAPELEFSVVVQEFSYAQRVEFVQGNGEHPFADEDQRRAQIVLQLRCRGKVALLGWAGLAVQGAADGGEELALTGLQPEGVITASHDLKADPSAQLASLSLPLTRQPLRGLSRLDGTVEVRFSREAARPERIAFADLALNQDRPIPGIEGGTLALTDRGDNRLVFRLSPPAFLVVQDIVCVGDDGKEIPGRNRRAELRDNQGQLTYNLKPDRVANLDVLVYRAVETRRVPISCTGLSLGMAVPGREDLRGPVTRGAEEF